MCCWQILDEMPVFYNLNAVEKREVVIVILQIVRNLDDASLVKAWQQSIARTRLFFKLLEECLVLFEVWFAHCFHLFILESWVNWFVSYFGMSILLNYPYQIAWRISPSKTLTWYIVLQSKFSTFISCKTLQPISLSVFSWF